MLSVALVRHALATVFGNLVEALKASVVAFAIVFVVMLIMAVPQPTETYLAGLSTPELERVVQEFAVQTAFSTLVVAVVSIFAFSWVAVTWHRFILLEEYPAAVPGVAGRPIGRYVWRSFLAGLIVVAAAIPLMFLLLTLLGPGVQGNVTAGFSPLPSALFLVVGAILTFIWLRVAIDLPGTATGETVGFAEAWRASTPLAGTIFGVAAILVGFNLVMQAVLGAVIVPGSLVGQILTLVVQWITVMLGVSILTSLYGHIIEGRDLT